MTLYCIISRTASLPAKSSHSTWYNDNTQTVVPRGPRLDDAHSPRPFQKLSRRSHISSSTLQRPGEPPLLGQCNNNCWCPYNIWYYIPTRSYMYTHYTHVCIPLTGGLSTPPEFCSLPIASMGFYFCRSRPRREQIFKFAAQTPSESLLHGRITTAATGV